jgi:hypothetical protein
MSPGISGLGCRRTRALPVAVGHERPVECSQAVDATSADPCNTIDLFRCHFRGPCLEVAAPPAKNAKSRSYSVTTTGSYMLHVTHTGPVEGNQTPVMARSNLAGSPSIH